MPKFNFKSGFRPPFNLGRSDILNIIDFPQARSEDFEQLGITQIYTQLMAYIHQKQSVNEIIITHFLSGLFFYQK